MRAAFATLWLAFAGATTVSQQPQVLYSTASRALSIHGTGFAKTSWWNSGAKAPSADDFEFTFVPPLEGKYNITSFTDTVITLGLKKGQSWTASDADLGTTIFLTSLKIKGVEALSGPAQIANIILTPKVYHPKQPTLTSKLVVRGVGFRKEERTKLLFDPPLPDDHYTARVLSRERIEITLSAGKAWRADGKAGLLKLVGINTGAGDLHFRAGIIVAKASAPSTPDPRNDTIWGELTLPAYEDVKAKLDSLIAAEPEFGMWLKMNPVRVVEDRSSWSQNPQWFLNNERVVGDIIDHLKSAYIAYKLQKRNAEHVRRYTTELRAKNADYEYLKAEMSRLVRNDPDFGVWLKTTFTKTAILYGALGRRSEAEYYSRTYYGRSARPTSPHGCESFNPSGSPISLPISSYEPCEWTSIVDTGMLWKRFPADSFFHVSWSSCSVSEDLYYNYKGKPSRCGCGTPSQCAQSVSNYLLPTVPADVDKKITANFKRYITEMHLQDCDPAAIAAAEAREEAEYQLKIANLRPGDKVPARTKSDSTAWAKHLAAHLDALINGRFSEQDVLTGKGGARTAPTAPHGNNMTIRNNPRWRRGSSEPEAAATDVIGDEPFVELVSDDWKVN